MNFRLIPIARADSFDWKDQYTDYYSAIGLRTDLAAGSLSSIVGVFLPYLLTLAGLILFGMLVGGGFTMLSGAANKESQEKGKKMITSAFIGFGVIFLAYWIAQILQVIFKVGIVNQ